MLLRPAQVLPEFLIHVYFRNVERVGNYGDEGEEENLRSESDDTLSLLMPPSDALGACDGAAMTLLRNEYLYKKDAMQGAPQHPRHRQQSNFDPQEAVRLKQSALLRIESAIDEFRSQKVDLLRSSCERLKGLIT